MVKDIHERMPVILSPDDYAEWLSRDQDDVVALRALLKPYAPDAMTAYAVSTKVNNVRNDSPELLEPAEDNGKD